MTSDEEYLRYMAQHRGLGWFHLGVGGLSLLAAWRNAFTDGNYAAVALFGGLMFLAAGMTNLIKGRPQLVTGLRIGAVLFGVISVIFALNGLSN